MCYARSRVEMVNPEMNEEPEDSMFYKLMHHNEKKAWTIPRAEDNYERMVEMHNAPTEEGSTPKTAEEIREVVLGVKPGYTPGLGYGVVPPTRRAGVHVVVAACVEVEQLRARAKNTKHELQELREQHGQLREQHDQLREQQSAQQRQLDYIMS